MKDALPLPNFARFHAHKACRQGPVEDNMRQALFAFALLACAGCNTISGLGKDLQAIGTVMTDTAEEAK